METRTKIYCPNCNSIKKGVLLEVYPGCKGKIRIKCKKCDAYIVLDLENNKVEEIETKK